MSISATSAAEIDDRLPAEAHPDRCRGIGYMIEAPDQTRGNGPWSKATDRRCDVPPGTNRRSARGSPAGLRFRLDGQLRAPFSPVLLDGRGAASLASGLSSGSSEPRFRDDLNQRNGGP